MAPSRSDTLKTLNINGQTRQVDVPDDMPLLWVIRDVLGMTGTKFGCGIAQCGACTVNVGGEAVRSCLYPIGSLGDRLVVTIEAIGATPNGAKVQKAWLDREVVQCGYCQSGPDHVRDGASRQEAQTVGPPTSTTRCLATSAGAAPTSVSVPPSTPPRRPEMPITSREVPSRRFVLKASVLAGGGLLLSMRLPGLARAAAPADPAFLEPNAFVRIDATGKVTLIAPACGNRSGHRDRAGDARRRRTRCRPRSDPRRERASGLDEST